MARKLEGHDMSMAYTQWLSCVNVYTLYTATTATSFPLMNKVLKIVAKEVICDVTSSVLNIDDW